MGYTEFHDGFDFYAQSQIGQRWDSASQSNNTTTGRYGTGQAFRLDVSSNGALLQASGATTTGRGLLSQTVSKTIGFAINFNNAIGAGFIMGFYDGATLQCDLRMNSSRQLQVTRNGTVLATSSNAMLLGVWYYVQFSVTIGASAAYAVSVNDTSWISGTGNTQNTGNAWINGLVVQSAAGNVVFFDDLYVRTDTTMLGESVLIADEPNADGDTDQWTTNSGTNTFSRVNSNDTDTSYISDSTVGDIALVKYPSWTLGGGTIVSVQNVYAARKDDAGSRSVIPETKSGGTVYDGTSSGALTSSYQYFATPQENDPATGVAWTPTGVSNVQLGVKVNS